MISGESRLRCLPLGQFGSYSGLRGTTGIMLFLLYVVSLIGFCAGAWVVPFLFMPFVWAYKYICKEPIIFPEHPAFLMPFVSAAILLLYATQYIWAQLGYQMGWLFPVVVAVVHVLFGCAQGANRPNQAQASERCMV